MVSDHETVGMKTDSNLNKTGNVWTSNADLPQLTHDVNSNLTYNFDDLHLPYFRNVLFFHIWNHLRKVFQII